MDSEKNENSQDSKEDSCDNENVAASPERIHVNEAWCQEYQSLMTELANGLKKATENIFAIKQSHSPLEFAKKGHDEYLKLMPLNTPKYLFIGLNPTPHASQRGIPFGSKYAVTNILGIKYKGTVPFTSPKLDEQFPPSSDHSGKFWSWVEQKCEKDLKRFFNKCFVFDYCPLLFFDSNDRPVPFELITNGLVRDQCDSALRKMIELTQPTTIIAVGTFVYSRVKSTKPDCSVYYMPHPTISSHAEDYELLGDVEVKEKWIEQVDDTFAKQEFVINL